MRRWHSSSLTPLSLLVLASLAHPSAAAVDRWSPIGPDGGTVLALAADPATPGTLYAGSDGGGVWKSTDGGGHWLSASKGLTDLGASEVSALATAPTAPGTVWAGTHGGIYKTTDGGATWRRVWYEADRPDDTYTPWTVSLAADPGDSGVAWAGTARGWILKTTDGGATWTQVLDLTGEANRLLIDPADPATVYANGRAGLHQTTDGGATWARLRDGADALALDPVAPQTLYASGALEDLTGVWKSTDGGATWSRLPGFEDEFVKVLLVDPFAPSVLLAGSSAVMLRRSEDGGETWQTVPGLPFLLGATLEADPVEPGRIWLGGNEQGVFRSSDAGRTWQASRQGLAASHLLAVAFDAIRPRYLYTAAIATGVHRTPDLGRSWARINAKLPASGGYGVDVNTVAAHPLRPGTLFAGTGGGVYRSLDRGARWSRVSSVASEDFNTFAFDPIRPDTIFAAGNILVRSHNGGRTWKRLTLPATTYEPEIAEVIVSPLRPKTVFVLDFNQRRGEARSLFRSPDGGNTWKQVFENGAAALAPHPLDPDILYLATEAAREIWRSSDDGLTWEMVATGVGGGAVLTTLLVDRVDPDTLYLGTDGTGIWRSRDGGNTWAPFNPGLIAPRITCLRSKPENPRRLFACTWGGGLQEIFLRASG